MAQKANELPNETASDALADISINRMSIIEVDAALLKCNTQLKETSTSIKELLENGAQSIPPAKVQQLRKINARKSKLIVRRITLLSQSPDSKIKLLLDQLLAIKPQAI